MLLLFSDASAPETAAPSPDAADDDEDDVRHNNKKMMMMSMIMMMMAKNTSSLTMEANECFLPRPLATVALDDREEDSLPRPLK